MRALVIVLAVLITNIYAVNFKAHYVTNNDLTLLKQIKEYGNEYNLSYSLMAIAVKESSIGRFKINVDSFDYGLYQANINTVVRRQNVKNSAFNRNKLAMLLINDFDFATSNAIAELVFWKKVHKGNWSKIWGSYNAGWNYDSTRGQKYSKDIVKIIQELKKIEALNS
jgi:hypothetical protein